MSEFLFLEALNWILRVLWQMVKVWWWVLPPIILFFPLKFLYLWYIEERWFEKNVDMMLLEIRIPRQVERPFKAMEQVISGFWGFYDPPNFREKWIEGKFLLDFSMEIVSFGGEVHFLLRVPRAMRDFFESAVFSQYPDVEIFEVEDYAKNVPQNIPNEDWDMWGCDFELMKPDCYPIKTYQSFFEPTPEAKEEKRIDPLSNLLEGMAKMKKGEQMWLQIIVKPVTSQENDWIKRGKKEVDTLARRPTPPPKKSIVGEALKTLITGQPPFKEEKKEEPIIPPEMALTPGETEVIRGIESKISKKGFETNIRYIYLGRREVFFKPNLRLILTFSNGLSTENLNGLKPWGKTLTKVQGPTLFQKRRLYLRKRRLFRRYVARVTPLYPRPGKTYVLNTEELATLYHFPSRLAAPTLPRMEAKKGGPPTGLPTE